MLPKMLFGRTGHESTRTLFGAAALSRVSQHDADRTLDVLLAYGVNHIDTAASYGDAEELIGPWMPEHREKFFLATKVEERTYAAAWSSMRRSLSRMRVDYVDLMQLHNVSDGATWDQVMGPDGALAALLEAQAQGLTRFIGITGHGLDICRLHLAALDRADFDSVLLPYNFPMMQNADYAAGFEALLSECDRRNVAVQAIKTLTRRPWGDQPPSRATWYEPLEAEAAIDAAVQWVFDRPQLFLNTPGDIDLLPRVLDAATRFVPGLPAPDMGAVAEAQAMAPLFV